MRLNERANEYDLQKLSSIALPSSPKAQNVYHKPGGIVVDVDVYVYPEPTALGGGLNTVGGLVTTGGLLGAVLVVVVAVGPIGSLSSSINRSNPTGTIVEPALPDQEYVTV
jgi:hypothetical protein